MKPRKRQQVQVSWYSDDGSLAAHSGDDRAPGSAAVSAVSFASSSVRIPVASPYGVPSLKPQKTLIMKPEKQHFAYMGQQSSPCQNVLVVARTRLIQPGQGMAERQLVSQALTSCQWQPINQTSYPIQVNESA
jgi:hypothetical protein